jgi:beta-alanine degradation protein BauB
MKVIKIIFMLLLFALSPSVYMNLYSQDPPTVAPHIYKKIALDNDKVRVMEVEIAAGDVVPWHHHPDHVIYVLTDGKIEITDKGKDPGTMEIKAGDVLFIPAVTHMAKNVGTTTVKLIVTEIKHGKKMKK